MWLHTQKTAKSNASKQHTTGMFEGFSDWKRHDSLRPEFGKLPVEFQEPRRAGCQYLDRRSIMCRVTFRVRGAPLGTGSFAGSMCAIATSRSLT
jgi:hypothetical protein